MFALALTEDELHVLHEALEVTSAIKSAQGLTEAAAVLTALRERADELPLTQHADQRNTVPREQGGVVNQSVSGNVTGTVVQTERIDGGLRF